MRLLGIISVGFDVTDKLLIEIGLVVNTEETKYILLSHHQATYYCSIFKLTSQVLS
jgi:hypothetical protein